MNRKHYRKKINKNYKMSRGPKTKNSFLNYLRDLRKRLSGYTAIEIAILGGNDWNQMTEFEKFPYILMAHKIKHLEIRRQILERDTSTQKINTEKKVKFANYIN